MSCISPVRFGFFLFAGASLVASLCGQDPSGGRIESPAVPAEADPSSAESMPVAVPVASADLVPVAIPVDPNPVFARDAPGQAAMAAPPSVPLPAMPPESAPAGVKISEMQSQSRVIEVERPERVQVYRDDPESAWWEVNPYFAFDRARREQRPLLLLFTAAWNEQAMALSQEVFATNSFNEYVKENLVICFLNYPSNITEAPETLRRIKDRYKVRGYPNMLIFNPNGEVERGIRGYRTGRPVDYFNELKGVCDPVLESVKAQKTRLVARGYRDWSNYLGREIFAKFVKHDTVHVSLEDATGQQWIVPINDLAPEDQKMVESFPAVAKFGPG